jgi:hypothetical protein
MEQHFAEETWGQRIFEGKQRAEALVAILTAAQHLENAGEIGRSLGRVLTSAAEVSDALSDDLWRFRKEVLVAYSGTLKRPTD